ncbi:MAG: LLM class F420-dependent oxidoreductase [Ilumatobacteraceae bacterium]
MTFSLGMSMYPFNRYMDARSVFETAQLAEELGFDTITIGEHVVVPHSHLDQLPARWFDSLVLGSSIAARTTRLRIMFSVLVVPYYNPIHLAKALASLDVLSEGRVIVGVGAGWLKPEFEMLGIPFDDRGARLDEHLRAIRELWTSDNPTFEGRWFQFRDVAFEPRPFQDPHPPIWIGGWGKNARRRAVELGDGLYPASAGPLSRIVDDITAVTAMLEDAGRDPAAFTFGHAIDYGSMAGPSHLEESSPIKREPLIFGYDAEPILDHIGKAREAGTSHIAVRFPGDTQAQIVDDMRRFHDEVMVAVRA